MFWNTESTRQNTHYNIKHWTLNIHSCKWQIVNQNRNYHKQYIMNAYKIIRWKSKRMEITMLKRFQITGEWWNFLQRFAAHFVQFPIKMRREKKTHLKCWTVKNWLALEPEKEQIEEKKKKLFTSKHNWLTLKLMRAPVLKTNDQ